LLFKAEKKIRFGLGVDLDPEMIRFANEKKGRVKSVKIKFVQANINTLEKLSEFNIDIAMSTLCLHEMKEAEAVNTLISLASISTTMLIADYSIPRSFWGKASIELDELISGYYDRFRRYKKNGYFPYLANKAGLIISRTIETPIDGIIVWKLDTKNIE